MAKKKETIEKTVTSEDLEMNPSLEKDALAGDTIEIESEAIAQTEEEVAGATEAKEPHGEIGREMVEKEIESWKKNPLTEADAKADLAGEPRPDNPSDEATAKQEAESAPEKKRKLPIHPKAARIASEVMTAMSEAKTDKERAKVAIALMKQFSVGHSLWDRVIIEIDEFKIK